MRWAPSTCCQVVAWNIGDSSEKAVHICSYQFFRFSVEFFIGIHMTWHAPRRVKHCISNFQLGICFDGRRQSSKIAGEHFLLPATCVIKVVLWFYNTTQKFDLKNCAAHAYSPVMQSYMNSLRRYRNATSSERKNCGADVPLRCSSVIVRAAVSCEQQNVWPRHARQIFDEWK